MESGAATDALLRLVRWLALAFVVLQFALYTPPPELVLPFSRWTGAAAAALPLVLLNGLSLVAGAQLRRRWPRSWSAAQVAADAAVAAGLVAAFSFDPSSALWAVLVLPVLEGALTAQRRGALVTWAVLSVAYLGRDLWAASHYPQGAFYADSVTYRTGIVGIVALATGSLAQRLATQVEEGDILRRVAGATRRMSSLHEAAVLREVLEAASGAGAATVRLLLPCASGGWVEADPVSGTAPGPLPSGTVGAGWRPSPALGVALADPGASSSSLPDSRLSALLGAAPEARVLVVPLRGPDGPLALLVAVHVGVLPTQLVEALELLAAHAAIAVGNARLHGQHEAVQDELSHQALHDALTELPNRRLLHDRARLALADRTTTGGTVAVLLLDLDGFKEINDTFGHAYGDGLLRQVAARMGGTLREADTAARLGGDEFAVLAVGLGDGTDASAAAARLQVALHQPFLVDGITLDVEASIGIALAPDHGDDIDTLLRCADVAMYAAKRTRAGITVYDPVHDSHTPDRISLLGDLRRALEDPAQLQLHYQPKVDLCGALVGVEALLRWVHPDRGAVPPGQFIATAEGTGIIHPLTRHVLEVALAQARRWHDDGHWVPVAVNLSTRCLLDLTLPDQVAHLLHRYGLPATLLCLEITETSMLADPERALTVLHRLAGQGVRLSVDDFGTGYSSMDYLRRLPVDELKVDRSFVSRVCEGGTDAVVVRSIIELGHNLGLLVVAEGVEDAATLRALEGLGCDVIQGYYTGRPAPADALSQRLAGRAGATRAAVA